MKRPKLKRYKKHKDMIKAAISNIPERLHAKLTAAFNKQEEERRKDEEFIQKNRLEIEINRRANSA